MNDDREITRIVEGWLSEPSPELDDGVLRDVTDRLPSMPQRHRWWPFRRFPLGIGVHTGLHAERTGSMEVSMIMSNVARMTVLAVIVGIVGTFAYVGLFEPVSAPPVPPGASEPSPSPTPAPTPDPAVGVRVTGTSGFRIDEVGQDLDGHLRGRLASAMFLQMDDPRLMGESDFLMNADDYGGVGPQWGRLRFFNDDGSWEGQVEGWFWNHETRIAGNLTGAGAYDGLTFYVEALVDNYGDIQYTGAIFPGDAPSEGASA